MSCKTPGIFGAASWAASRARLSSFHPRTTARAIPQRSRLYARGYLSCLSPSRKRLRSSQGKFRRAQKICGGSERLHLKSPPPRACWQHRRLGRGDLQMGFGNPSCQDLPRSAAGAGCPDPHPDPTGAMAARLAQRRRAIGAGLSRVLGVKGQVPGLPGPATFSGWGQMGATPPRWQNERNGWGWRGKPRRPSGGGRSLPFPAVSSGDRRKTEIGHRSLVDVWSPRLSH